MLIGGQMLLYAAPAPAGAVSRRQRTARATSARRMAHLAWARRVARRNTWHLNAAGIDEIYGGRSFLRKDSATRVK